jgi:ketosteroid isomerase-like protein
MMSDIETTIRELYEIYRGKDLDGVAAALPDHFEFRMNLPGDRFPGASQNLNRTESLKAFSLLMDSYDFKDIKVGPITTDGQRAFVQPVIHYRHKTTGEEIETTLMHVWTLRDGKPARLEEFHDVDITLAHLDRVAGCSGKAA